MSLTAGKKEGLQAVTDSCGVIAARAIDQRIASRKLFAKAMNVQPECVPADKLVQFKDAVSRILTPHARVILLDLEFGLPAAKHSGKNTGLLLAYEKTGYDKTVPGRLPQLLDAWSVSRLRGAAANCDKLLLYYSSTHAACINDTKHAFVERVGAEYASADIPFFLELVTYGEGLDDKGSELARIKPEVVARSMEEFSKFICGVDLLKVGIPVNLTFVQGSPSCEILYTHAEALEHYRRPNFLATAHPLFSDSPAPQAAKLPRRKGGVRS
jgi:tagatose 1,6-diphosphate aldolase